MLLAGRNLPQFNQFTDPVFPNYSGVKHNLLLVGFRTLIKLLLGTLVNCRHSLGFCFTHNKSQHGDHCKHIRDKLEMRGHLISTLNIKQ